MNIADWFNMAGSIIPFFSLIVLRTWECPRADNNKELRESKENFIIFFKLHTRSIMMSSPIISNDQRAFFCSRSGHSRSLIYFKISQVNKFHTACILSWNFQSIGFTSVAISSQTPNQLIIASLSPRLARYTYKLSQVIKFYRTFS